MDDPLPDVSTNGIISPSEDDPLAFAAHAAAQAMSESDAVTNGEGVHGTTSQERHLQQQQKCAQTSPPENGVNGDGEENSAVREQQQQQDEEPVSSPQVVVSDTGSNNMTCRICGRGDEDARPMLRFLPVEHDANAAAAAPTVLTFTEDICVHIFCGKTASILPSVNQPELEILTKAGLKNKHGIGPEVNAALARTRCAILAQEGAKEKHYYLVREFEAHLAAIRHIHITFVPESGPGQSMHQVQHQHYLNQQNHNNPFVMTEAAAIAAAASEIPCVEQPPPHQLNLTHHLSPHHAYDPNISVALDQMQQQHLIDPSQQHQMKLIQPSPPTGSPKVPPVKAAAGHFQKIPMTQQQQQYLLMPAVTAAELTSDGKVRCACGGTHLPPTVPRGMQSWRNHFMTKRHQKWLEENGMIGAV